MCSLFGWTFSVQYDCFRVPSSDLKVLLVFNNSSWPPENAVLGKEKQTLWLELWKKGGAS